MAAQLDRIHVDPRDIERDYLIARMIETQAALNNTLVQIQKELSRIADAKGVERMPRTIKRNEVAELCGVKPETVDNWVSKGKIPYRKANGSVFFVLEEILQWTKPLPKK
jgi:predicted DNA-binding transcriptional regulator AlpA